MILVAGRVVEDECGVEQPVTGLKPSIEGAIRVMTNLYDEFTRDGWQQMYSI